MELSNRWQTLCNSLGIEADTTTYRSLLRAYSNWFRHYHSLDHLQACLVELDSVLSLTSQPAEVEMALWFHDAIYKTRSKDNEDRSAEWAREFLLGAGAITASIDRIVQYILATKHSDATLEGDAALVVDIDLSILGQPPDVYAGFEKKVRREYWWVPKARYRDGRSRILQSFLQRPSIYQTQFFRSRYEEQARLNVTAVLAKLRVN